MGPWWLWAIVVILAGTAGYAGLRVGASTQLLKDTDAAVLALAADKKRLEADLEDLRRQLAKAHESGAEVRSRLERSRAATDAASARAGELQIRVASLEAEVAAARAAADESNKQAERLAAEAAGAQTAFTQVRKLQERIAELKAEAAAARAKADESRRALERSSGEAAAAAEAKSALEREISSLKSALAQMQQRLNTAPVGATGTAP